MSKLDDHVAGMFRRGLPEGDQFDILVAWVALKLNQDAQTAGDILAALGAAVSRGTKRLSTL